MKGFDNEGGGGLKRGDSYPEHSGVTAVGISGVCMDFGTVTLASVVWPEGQ